MKVIITYSREFPDVLDPDVITEILTDIGNKEGLDLHTWKKYRSEREYANIILKL